MEENIKELQGQIDDLQEYFQRLVGANRALGEILKAVILAHPDKGGLITIIEARKEQMKADLLATASDELLDAALNTFDDLL